MTTYLTRSELQGLSGYTIKSAVLRWLDRQGWPYVIGGADGWPRVLRQYHDQRLLGLQPAPTRKRSGPNWTQP